MNKMFKISLSFLLVVGFTACGSGGGDSGVLLVNSEDSSASNNNGLIQEPVNTGNVPSISPSTQNSDDIISLIKNNSYDVVYDEIDTGIELSAAGRLDFGLDKDNKMVFVVYMTEQYFGKSNWVFCHEASNDCHRVIDNSTQQNSRRAVQYSDGKLFILMGDKRVDTGTYGTTFNMYDPNTKELTIRALDLSGIDGESVSMSKGIDGYIYVSGSNHLDSKHYASYAKVDPKDLSVTYHTGYYKGLYVNRMRDTAADATHMYQAMGDTPWHLVSVNQQTQESEKLLEGKFFKLDQLQDGVALTYKDLHDVEKKAWLFNGQLYPVDSLDSRPPWYNSSTHPDNHPSDNPTGYWAYSGFWDLVPGIAKPKMTKTKIKTYATAPTPHMGTVELSTTLNGQEYNFSIEVDTYEKPTRGVQRIDENRMMILGRDYSGASVLDLTNESSKYLGSASVSARVTKPFLDYSDGKKKFIFSGYPSATTFFYELDDTDKKFSSENFKWQGYLRATADRNNIAAGIDVDIHRPTAMVQIDETLYITGMQYRSGVGGALVALNTQTNERYGIKKGIFDNYQPRDMIRIGNKLAIATQAVDNSSFGGSPRPSTPKIMIFDPVSQKIVKEYTPLSGLPPIDAGRIASLDDRHIIGFTNNGGTPDNQSLNYSSRMYLYIIDTYTDKVVMIKTFEKGSYMRVESSGSAFIDGFEFKVNGDYIYTWFLARNLTTIDKNGNVEIHGIMPYQSRMGFANGYIYFSGDKKLRKTSNPKR